MPRGAVGTCHSTEEDEVDEGNKEMTDKGRSFGADEDQRSTDPTEEITDSKDGVIKYKDEEDKKED